MSSSLSGIATVDASFLSSIACFWPSRPDRETQRWRPKPNNRLFRRQPAFDPSGRAPLNFLAGIPPGNVAGVIELEGEASKEFGGGDDAAEGKVGSGSERVARLSASAYEAAMLTPNWRCKARLAAGSWFQAHWPVSIVVGTVSISRFCRKRECWGWKTLAVFS